MTCPQAPVDIFTIIATTKIRQQKNLSNLVRTAPFWKTLFGTSAYWVKLIKYESQIDKNTRNILQGR